MAAEIQSDSYNSGTVRKKPYLLNKLEGCDSTINAAVMIPREEGVISVSSDRNLRVWLKRDSGQYWPSICHPMPAIPTSLSYNMETRRLFVGMENGTISEFSLSEDYNRISHQRDYLAHQSNVTQVHFVLPCEWVLSCGRDKYFTWHCSETGRRLGGFQANSWCTALDFDIQTKHAFIGDLSGAITVLKVDNNDYVYITTLKGHSGSIRCLAWDPVKRLLCSGSFDQLVIVWDIGGQKGTAFELQGHHQKVTGLSYATGTQQLFSAAEDCIIITWDMTLQRNETPDWLDSDTCQKCGEPFFWNVKDMWDRKTIGVRQHHCRKCGRAVCDKCSAHRSRLPLLGHEFEVRVCDDCVRSLSEDDKKSHALFHDARHHVVCMNLDETTGRLVTAGTDSVIKIWDVSHMVNP
ncbi:PREDICTED: WD repeat and FYVE domain-containing protein 2-like [Priapulus caudatus]|uniref:WD repeat and FYVE domain-containing protein 2-like n=1 Tax=Priapulus caudatus TaxID=37621 RepID=A0ABM1DRD4_PRICU|nr:PREDICTED: WD repeat and FYVE domain-containing protein 2-like [Priapulus caudatus]